MGRPLASFVSVSGCENHHSFAWVQSNVRAGGLYLAALCHRHHDAAGRPVDVVDASPARRRIWGDL